MIITRVPRPAGAADLIRRWASEAASRFLGIGSYRHALRRTSDGRPAYRNIIGSAFAWCALVLNTLAAQESVEISPRDLQAEHAERVRAERVAEFLETWVAVPDPGMRERAGDVLARARVRGAAPTQPPSLEILAAARRALLGERTEDDLQLLVDMLDLRCVPGIAPAHFDETSLSTAIVVTVSPLVEIGSLLPAHVFDLELYWISPDGERIRARGETFWPLDLRREGLEMYIRSPLGIPGIWHLQAQITVDGNRRVRGLPVPYAVVEALDDLVPEFRREFDESARPGAATLARDFTTAREFGWRPRALTLLVDALYGALDAQRPLAAPGLPANWPAEVGALATPERWRERAWHLDRPASPTTGTILLAVPAGTPPAAAFVGPQRTSFEELSARGVDVVALDLPLFGTAEEPLAWRELLATLETARAPGHTAARPWWIVAGDKTPVLTLHLRGSFATDLATRIDGLILQTVSSTLSATSPPLLPRLNDVTGILLVCEAPTAGPRPTQPTSGWTLWDHAGPLLSAELALAEILHAYGR